MTLKNAVLYPQLFMSHSPSTSPFSNKYEPSISVNLFFSLGSPDTLDGLGHTNIVGLELVQPNTDGDGGDVEKPPEDLAQTRMCSVGNVVDKDGLKADMGV